MNSESTYLNFRSNKDYYAVITKTNNENRLLAVVGNVAAVEANINAQQWVKVTHGYHYAYYFPTTMNTAYVDLATGLYDGEQKARLTAVTAEEGAQLVYTTDGSDPTATSTKAASGSTITIPVGTTMLKVALLVGGAVSGMTTRAYIVRDNASQQTVIPDFCQYSDGEVCAFFEAPRTWVQTITCWAWDTNANNVNYTGGNWPGIECKKLGQAPNGNTVWKWTFNEKDFQGAAGQAKLPSHIIFSSKGAPQTKDLPFHNAGYYTEEGYFATVESSIDGILADEPAYSKAIYTLDGRRVYNVTRPGLYIKNMKVIFIK